MGRCFCCWLVHRHSSCVSIKIIQPRRQIQSWCFSVKYPLYLLCFWRWISPDPSWRRSSGRPRTTWLDHISSNTGMCLTGTFSLAQDRSVDGSRYGRKGYAYLTDWLLVGQLVCKILIPTIPAGSRLLNLAWPGVVTYLAVLPCRQVSSWWSRNSRVVPSNS